MTDYICTLSEEKQNAIAKWLEGNGLNPEEVAEAMTDRVCNIEGLSEYIATMEDKKMIRHIVREVPGEHADFSYYFDDDYIRGYEENSMLFIIAPRGYSGFNEKEYDAIVNLADNILDGFDRIGGGIYDYANHKEVMEDYGIKYNSRKCHLLKEWAKTADTYDVDTIAKFQTIITGKTWDVTAARGYSQGDYVDIMYCPDHYTEKQARAYGEVWLGAAKEFCVIDLDENGEEENGCYGFIVADCEISSWADCDEEYKKIVCDWEGIDPDETRLEMVDGHHTYTEYTYREVA